MKSLAWILAASAALSCGAAEADFAHAVKHYAAGDYIAARTEFLGLAGLGDAASQYNLAAMAQQGQALPKSVAASVGWLLAAAENGYQRMPTEKLESIRGKLSDIQRLEAQEILDHYGRAALERTVLPPRDQPWACAGFVAPAAVRMHGLVDGFVSVSEVDGSQRSTSHPGIVAIESTIGTDGLARDPEIVAAAPGHELEASAIKALLMSEFSPATLNGVPAESRHTIAFRFQDSSHAGSWADSNFLKKLHANASGGDPDAHYIMAVAASVDDSIGIARAEADRILIKTAQGGHGAAQYRVGRRFESLAACGQDAKKMPWFNQAVIEGDEASQLALAQQVLRENPAAERIGRARNLLESAAKSDRFYVRKHAVALLAASPVEGLRNPQAALAAAARLVRDPIQADPQMFEAVAAAYAATGDFKHAAALQETAIGKAKDLHWRALRLMEERLADYRADKVWLGDLFQIAGDKATAGQGS